MRPDQLFIRAAAASSAAYSLGIFSITGRYLIWLAVSRAYRVSRTFKLA
jgi:hypothetical protein